ncbi:MAG: ROK family protein [Actinomycetota bacterium]|nr:ROK family protein [Actinomycetota bacterium]
MAIYGTIEGGGTKFVCAVGDTPQDLREIVTFPTTTPEETLGQAISFLANHGPLDAIGLAMFGPLDLNRSSATYGSVRATPKPGWSGVDVVSPFHETFGVPVGFDTDVNGAALGEGRWGAGSGLDTFLYVTVGTGIGGGGVIGGDPMHGLVHPEIGHLRVPRHHEDSYAGRCPFHGDCLEGLASGPALADRWGRPVEELGADIDRAIEFEAFVLGHAMANLVLTISPERIILGGGVMKIPGLLGATRNQMLESLRGYVDAHELNDGIEQFLVAPELGDRSGIAGGLVLAERASSESNR